MLLPLPFFEAYLSHKKIERVQRPANPAATMGTSRSACALTLPERRLIPQWSYRMINASARSTDWNDLMTAKKSLQPSAEDLHLIRETVRAVVTRFDDEYWLKRDDDGKFPHE